jgi:hypothetical protein
MESIIDALAVNLDALFALAVVMFLAGCFHALFKFTDGQEEE